MQWIAKLAWVLALGVGSPESPRSPAPPKPPPLLVCVVDLDDPVRVGGKAVYEVRVFNASTKACHDLCLWVETPPGMKVRRIEAPVGYNYHEPCDLVMFKTIDSLASREDAIFRIECDVEEAATEPVRLRAMLSTPDYSDDIIEDETTRVLPAKPAR